MNNDRRKAITSLIAILEGVDIVALQDEEQEYIDAMPDSFRDGEKGERAQAALDALEEAASDLANCLEQLGNALEA